MKNIFFCFYATLAVVQAQLTSQELFINEILASNDTAFSPNGSTFPDAIELKNLTNGTLDLSQYGISDSDGGARYSLPVGTVIPANGLLVILANGEGSGLEADFKLSAGGETVHLTDPAGNTVDRVRFARQRADISFGRLSDQSFAFFPSPTIGSENDEKNALQALIQRPSIDQESGIYSGSLMVTLQAEAGQQIRYTLDSSQPDENSLLYDGPLTFSDTTVLKTIAIENGIPSEVGMRTFLFDAVHELPVILLTTERFVDRQFVNDSATINETVYSRFDIDGRIRSDFLEPDGSLPLSQYVEFKTSGLSSKAIPPINGKITARSKLGKGSLRHRIFPEKEGQELFERILVRNTSQDFNGARMRDGLFSRFISTGNIVNLEHEGYRPAVLYVNGIYMGHINLREDDDSAFAEQYYGFERPITRRYVEYPSNGIFADTPVVNPTSSDAVERVNMIRNVNESLFDGVLRVSMSVSEGSRLFISSDPADQIRLSLHDYDFAFGGSSGFLPGGPGWNQRWPFSFHPQDSSTGREIGRVLVKRRCNLQPPTSTCSLMEHA